MPVIPVTFNVAADARVEQDLATSNFGTSSKLRATNGPVMESYLRFTLAGITGERDRKSVV